MTNMNIPEVIAALERSIRLERGIPAKRTAVAAAQAALEEAPIGHKKVLARAALREAEEALDKQTQALAEVSATLPDPDTINISWVIREVAEARVDRGHLQKELAAAEAALAAAQEAAKGGEWKWKGRKDAPEAKEVVAARAVIAAVNEKLAALTKRVAPYVEIIEKEMDFQKERAESAAWAARGFSGPTPEHILRAEEERRKEFEADCVVIRIPQNREEWVAYLAKRPVFKEEVEEEFAPDDDWEAGVAAFARIMAGDFSDYMPKVEAAPVVKKSKAKTGTSAWVEKMIAARKARLAAAAAGAGSS